jgi:type III secretion protein R
MDKIHSISGRKVFFLIMILGVLWVSHENLFSEPRSTTSIEPHNNSIAQSTPPTAPKPSVTPVKPGATPATPGAPGATPSKEELLLKQKELLEKFDTFKKPSLITQAAVLSLLSLLPFIIMILTSFMKIVIVLSLLRNALGVQQAPPNQIINGVAVMLSLFIMYPTVVKMYEASQVVVAQTAAPDSLVSPESSTYILNLMTATEEPLRQFLINNSSVKHRAMFYRMSYKVLPEEYRPELTPEDFMIVVPSFITSQLKDAFEIGVLIYIPFFVIDLVTSNVLLAMGMMMLSPVTISMPLKLFLLVMLDGWSLLVEGLVNTFR